MEKWILLSVEKLKLSYPQKSMEKRKILRGSSD